MFCVLGPSMFLGLTGGRAGGYVLVGVCIDAGDEVNEVAGRGNEKGVCAVVAWVYRGVVDCAVGHREA
jgi:hypothetical protein